MKRSLLALALVLTLALPARAQVTVAPTFVYMASPERYGTMRVVNTSGAMQEVDIGFQFGYPASDADGGRYIEYADSTAAAAYAMTPWVRAFPRKFRLRPGGEQVVRLMAAPPADLPLGVYWTRVVVTSEEEGGLSGQAVRPVAAQLGFRFRQVIPLVFHQGRASTDLSVRNVSVDVGPDEVAFLADVARDGDAPFFGTVSLEVSTLDGRPVTRVERSTEVYFAYAQHIAVERALLRPGRYRAALTFRAERPDVTGKALPAMAPVIQHLTFDVGH